MWLILILVMLFLPIYASYKVKSTFADFSKVHNARGLTADQVARQILDSNGLYNVGIERIPGNLSDHYDPKANVVRLSESVYGQTSVAAIGVAAHECGHACQHAEEYTPIKIRTSLVPVTNFCSKFWYFAFILGIILFESMPELVWVGIIMFSAVVLFQLVTLPVEFDASNRALKTLENDCILESDELGGAKKVLKAAAMTYVTALVVSIIQLLRLLASAKRR